MTAPHAEASPAIAESAVTELLRATLADGVTVSGVRFVQPARRMSFEHRQYVVDRIDDAKILPLLAEIPDDPDRLAAAMLRAAFRSGQLFVILAGLLVVEGEPWTPARAAIHARQFAETDDDEVIDRLRELFLWLVLDFFTARVGSGRIFLKSLAVRTDPAADSATPPRPSADGNASSANGAVATPTTATSPTSSAPSPSTDASG